MLTKEWDSLVSQAYRMKSVDEDDDAKAVKAIVSLILFPVAIAALPFNAIVRAWVACKLWAWFILPQFHLPTPRLWMMLGVIYAVQFISRPLDIGPWKDSEEPPKSMIRAIIAPGAVSLVTLFFGWLIHLAA